MMRTHRPLRRRSPVGRQRVGVTLLLIMVLIVLAALVGVLAVRGATSDLQMAGSQRVSRTGFYCAEGALNVARSYVAANPKQWATILSGGTTTWYTSATTGMPVDVDGDGNMDADVLMIDNQDDGDPAHDQDGTVILKATCRSTSNLEANGGQRTVAQIVTYAGNGGTDYRYQAGHSSTHSGNEN
jgi:hypothetical protein